MRWLSIIVLLIFAVLGYGYWHVKTHGAINISIYDASDEKSFTTLKGSSIILKDTNGSLLAAGQSDLDYGVIHLIHPARGSCYEVERNAPFSSEGRNAWQECFGQQSTWLMEWVREIKFADVIYNNCLLEDIPVKLHEFPEDWWMWWIPLPHVGGNPYTYFSITLRIDPVTCKVMNK